MTRLAVYALLLAAVFGAAAALGRAVGPLERGRVDAAGHAKEADGPAAGAAVPGLAIAAGGLRLEVPRTRLRAGRSEAFAFRIVRGASAVRSFELEHERRMHLIVVRRDMTGFRHVHPRMRPDGTWTVPLRLPAPGVYRAFADFSTGGRRLTLGVDLFAPGDIGPELRIAEPRVKRAGPYGVALEAGMPRAGRAAELVFRVSRGGRAAALGRYLGARGHLVVLRAGDLAYVHAHADDDALSFETTFPSAGSYRAFVQFRAGGAVRTAAFTVQVRP